ncbi:peptidase E [Nocardioides sp. CER19]|uniref:Type 1 glutamine amidotransferase-like domain-containing protein n=1 Tax=Nocardioides sp. CER19 TaxID=3038538 RepID=UPI00244AB431|nr:peptidase E [Nocardioides sp. CER19]MDH2413181.1 peptidase E [Nocardioides sp. CER19]
MTATILTLGGGGFSMSEDGSSLIDDLLLSLTGKDRPRVCFVPTASGDSKEYADRFLAAFEGRARTSVLSLFCRDPWGYGEPKTLLDQDVVYVGGGSTANLLALWRLHGVDRVLRQAAEEGTVLAGISAGMNCWFEGSSTDSYGPLAALPDGLGFLPGSACPHYLGEAERRAAYHAMVGSGRLPGGHAADDGVALLWRDGALVEAVSERPDGQAFRVDLVDGEVVERPLEVRYLG